MSYNSSIVRVFKDPISEEIQSLVKEENPEAFRRGAISFLNKNGFFVDHLMKYPAQHIDVKSFLTKIFDTLNEDDYLVAGITPGLFNRSIPSLKIGKNLPNLGFSPITENRRQTPVSSKKEVDYLVSEISKMDVCWDYPAGCDAKADMVCKVLYKMNIPKENIKKIWITAEETRLKGKNNKGSPVEWDWHIASLIVMPSKEERVIDPYFSKTESLSKDSWISKMVNKGQKYHTEEIGGEFTFDVVSTAPVVVNEEISQFYRKTLVVHSYASAVPENSTLHQLLLNKLPRRINLGQFASLTPTTQSSSSPETEKTGSIACTIS